MGTLIDGADEDGHTITFRIDAVEPDPSDRDGEVRLYSLSVRSGDVGSWAPYCLPDREGRSRAIPLEGSWTDRGPVDGSAERVTFACTSGAIGKCIRFGYKPWKTVGGRSLAPFHAACVRMVRADYCGNGSPHTRDGTRIDVWDVLGVQKREPPAGSPEIFEAGWAPDGATWLDATRLGDRLDDIVRECPNKLRGRTLTGSSPSAPAEIARRFPESLLFNAHFAPLTAGGATTHQFDAGGSTGSAQ